MPASTDALRSYSGGAPAFFSPPLISVFFCVLLCSMFGLEMLCHFGRFYLSASVGVGLDLVSRAPETRVGGLTSLEWVCGLNVFPPGFHFVSSSLAGVWWPMVQCIIYSPHTV